MPKNLSNVATLCAGTAEHATPSDVDHPTPTSIPDPVAQEASLAWEQMERGTGTSERYQEALAAYRDAERSCSTNRVPARPPANRNIFWLLFALTTALIVIGILVMIT